MEIRTDYRRGYERGINDALGILETNEALTGLPVEAMKIALRCLRDGAVVAVAEPNGVAPGDAPKEGT